MIGAAFFVVPGLGPIAVSGPPLAAVIGGLEGPVVVGGLSAIGAGLYSIGIVKDSVLQYETALNAGKFLLIPHGSKDEIERARSVLAVHKPEAIEVQAAQSA